jgi:hypothetical protein
LAVCHPLSQRLMERFFRGRFLRGVSSRVLSRSPETQPTMRELVRQGPHRARPPPRPAPAHYPHRTPLPSPPPFPAKFPRGTPRPLIPAALFPRIDQRGSSPLTHRFYRRRLQSRVASAVTRSARSSGRSSPMSTASTPPVPTTATRTCSWSASTCTTTRRPAAATCPVTF